MATDAEREIFKELLQTHSVFYITVETKYTMHHIERLMGTVRDRGRWKWIAETKAEAFDAIEMIDEEARRSHIDEADLFPRYLFLDTSMHDELFAWLAIRALPIVNIKAPKL